MDRNSGDTIVTLSFSKLFDVEWESWHDPRTMRDHLSFKLSNLSDVDLDKLGEAFLAEKTKRKSECKSS